MDKINVGVVDMQRTGLCLIKRHAPGEDRTHDLQISKPFWLWDWRAAYCATEAMGNAALFCLAVAVNVSDAKYVIMTCIRHVNCVECVYYDWMANMLLWRIRNGSVVSKMYEGMGNEEFVLRLAELKKKDVTPTWFEHAAFWFLSTDIELESDALPLRHGVNRYRQR